MQIIKSVISNVLIALYQPFWFALLFSIVFMFCWKYSSTIKEDAKQWIGWFKKEKMFRRMFFLVFYTVMILFRTLINRNMWQNPVQDIIGIWGLYKENNGKMVLTTEVLENIALFMPFMFLFLWAYEGKLGGEETTIFIMKKSLYVSFGFSFVIEFLQLFLRLGTWQLSDLFYNTIGGLCGGLLYCCFRLARQHKNANANDVLEADK